MDLLSRMKGKVAENPFYGKTALKELLDRGKTVASRNQMYNLLENAWNECRDSKELREAFFITVFSIGEITNRQHFIFGRKKVDSGGNAARPQFMWIMSWLRAYNSPQYYKFMSARIINEYVSWFALLACQVRTNKGKSFISATDTATYQALIEHDLDKLAEYVASRLKIGTLIEKIQLAKWLVLPRLSKRQKINKSREKIGSRKLQEETISSMKVREEFLLKLSKLMNWEIIRHRNNVEFRGLKEFRKTYNSTLESVLFSTGRIRELDKEQFFNLVNEAPASARYRIQRRLVDGDGNSKKKWINNQGVDLAVWYKEWESFKENKQQEQRDLTEKIRQGTATEEDKIKLEKVKKEAKVTVGGLDLKHAFEQLQQKYTLDSKLLHSVLDKIEFKVPVLTIVDCSGSMEGNPIWIARLLATTTMLKNPSTELDTLLVTFGSRTTIYTNNCKADVKKNRFMSSKRIVKVDKLIDRTRDFIWNYQHISMFVNANQGATHFNSVATEIENWIEQDQDLKQNRIEQLQGYPVMLVISDGYMNSHSTTAESMLSFTQKLQHYGWNGVVVVWDVTRSEDNITSNKYNNVPNVIHYHGYNLGIINQIFTNIHDLDIIDVYTELKSLHASDRYQIIKENTL